MTECPFSSVGDIQTIDDLRKFVEWRKAYVSSELHKEREEYDADTSKHKKGSGYFLRAGMHSEIITVWALLNQVMNGEMNRDVTNE